MLSGKWQFRLFFFLAATLALSACADDKKYFEVGLKDSELGKPVMTEAQTASIFSAPQILETYRLENLKPAARPSKETDEGGYWFSADKHEQLVRTSGNLIKDEKLNAYVKGIICRLAGPYCPGIRLYIMRIPQLNANVMANGTTQVWSGLLLRSRDEAELAAVLGHEFGHYLRRHTLQSQRHIIEQTNMATLYTLGAFLGGAPAGSVDLMNMATNSSILAFSRNHEREADGYGLRLLYENKYDLSAPSEVWKRAIDEGKRAGQDGPLNPYSSTHPPDLERQAELKRLADVLSPTLISQDKGRERYLEHILPHRASFLEVEITKNPQKASLALLDILIEDGVRLGELYYFKGEVFRRSAKKNGAEEALKFYKKAIEAEGAPVEVFRSMALAELSLQKKEEAKRNFDIYLQKAPSASDAQIVRMQMEALK
ncbi:MAG: M48 family metalloprotease [Alphaproteobacteria bacterium]|nr:M48 family metalloprotease [Alphaproteobacteria bacterium]